jgi:hypothetical protein
LLTTSLPTSCQDNSIFITVSIHYLAISSCSSAYHANKQGANNDSGINVQQASGKEIEFKIK